VTPENARSLYLNRKLSEGYPNLERLGAEHFASAQQETVAIVSAVRCIERLIELPKGSPITVIGCGPKPFSVKALLDAEFDATGVEPVRDFVESARQYLGDDRRVSIGDAEHLSLADLSQRAVILESVLEHVDSPERTLAEAYRVLTPGGVLYVYTTNKYRFALSGANGEYRVPFFNWLPDIVKESYVHHHLHFDPALANFTSRPAVHWFTYSGLCRLGRSAGFYRFYSKVDLIDAEDPSLQTSWLRRSVFEHVRCRPWLRSLALTQFGNSIFMVKRP
jgi:ubiquinone/menaquinone biosynthesis C-methylase UbiE